MAALLPMSPSSTHLLLIPSYNTGPKLAGVIASCDAFLHANENEIFGLVVLAAMAAGLPVIGPDRGGVGELIDEPVGHQSVERPRPLDVIGPGRVQAAPRHRAVAVAQHREQPAARLPIRSAVLLDRTMDAVRGHAREPPRARRRERAVEAPRIAGPAAQRPQLHQSDGKSRREQSVVRQKRLGE